MDYTIAKFYALQQAIPKSKEDPSVQPFLLELMDGLEKVFGRMLIWKGPSSSWWKREGERSILTQPQRDCLDHAGIKSSNNYNIWSRRKKGL